MKWLLTTLLWAMMATATIAQTPPPQQKLDELLRLLQDPEIQTWLDSSKQTAAKTEVAPTSDLSDWETITRSRVHGIIAAIPRIPAEIGAAAARTRHDAIDHGYAPVLVIFAVLVGLGLLGEWLFMRWRSSGENTAINRLLPVAVFTGIMAVVFFAVEWPPLARIVLLVYLVSIVVYRIVSVLIDLADQSLHARRRMKIFCAVLLVALACSALAAPLSADPPVSAAISYCFSVILLLLAIESVWSARDRKSRIRLALTAFLVGIWILWCLGLGGLFWIGVYALVLPGLLRAVGKAATEAMPSEANSIRRVLVVRGSRAIVVLAAVAWLALVWRLNPDSITHIDPTVAAISYSLLRSVVVLLIADLVWHLARSWIDRTLSTVPEGSILPPAEAARRGRIRTLLPIFRNALAVIVAVMAALIVLSQLGVEIGPLIAGAGIFGVAIGFGSQTLVKDVISGVFYMLDDAFRVGEYIQAKSYKGTVEGFSLRSVRLRHHRGPVFTVPFGELGAVENMSRDWVIDKFRISVAYDTDIDKARKIAKAIGSDLQADPELGPMFLTPLKMKGVEEFGDYGIVLSFAMTTIPGQQTYIRRKAYAMIREAFKENGIEFATPSVQVGNDDKGSAAAAAAAVKISQEKNAAAES